MDHQQNLQFAHAQTKKFFRNSKPPAHCTTVVRELHKRLGMLSDVIIEERKIKLACQAGCSFCCHLRVDAYAHEVLHAAEYIRSHMTPDQIEAIIAKSNAHATKINALTLAGQMTSNNPCPLLGVDGRCGAYEARPMSCRCHHATDLKPCQHFFESGDPFTPSTQEPVLFENTRAVWMGVAKAYADEGYDGAIYDFGSAIGEALENTATARRWRDKKRAFSSQALAKDPPDEDTFRKKQPTAELLESIPTPPPLNV